MLFKPYPGTRKEIDLLSCIAPIFRFDLARGEVCLVGTGFWVTTTGHLVTAWHVIQENIDSGGADRGPIFAVQIAADRSLFVRNFVASDKHPQFDLALTETIAAPPAEERPTTPVGMSLDELEVGQQVFSFAVSADEGDAMNDALSKHTVYRFRSEVLSDLLPSAAPLRFSVQLSLGTVSEIFRTMRDSVMLPFPCLQTDLPIFGGNSGGPLFDIRGRVSAVHCTSYEGDSIAFHVPIQGVLGLRTRRTSVGINDAMRRQISLLEFAAVRGTMFEPPMLYLDRPGRSILRWLGYIVRCLARLEFPSMSVHLATGRDRVRARAK